MIEDIGEYIPFAKKENSTTKKKSSTSDNEIETLGLKNLWPEPDWKDMYLDGIDKEVLTEIYCIYHGLGKKPHTKPYYNFRGASVTVAMWEEAYERVVVYIRQACENIVTIEDITSLKDSFNDLFSENGKLTYLAFAAGVRTPKHCFPH